MAAGGEGREGEEEGVRRDKLRKMRIMRWKTTVGLGWLPRERDESGDVSGEMGWRGARRGNGAGVLDLGGRGLV